MVFDVDGRYEGTWELPGACVVHDSGHAWVLAVCRDENDVEFVNVYERNARTDG